MHNEEQFCETILNLGQWLRRYRLKMSYLELWHPPVRWRRTIYANLKDGIMGSIHVKLYGIWTSGQKEVSFKDISYQELWQPL